MTDITKHVLDEIAAERARQDAKWGEQNHHETIWLAILAEEVGEAAAAALQERKDGYRAEMMQVAAVAVAAIESFDRNEVGL